MSGKFTPHFGSGSPVQPATAPVVVKAAPNLPDIYLKLDSLPSKSLSYPNTSTIKYRPYTFGELKRFSQSKGLTFRENLDICMSGIETSFDKNDLTLSDVLYIGVLRRLSTLGTSKVQCPYVCPLCHTPNTRILEMTDLEFEDLQVPELPLVAEFSFGELEFQPITVGNYQKLIQLGKDEDEVAGMAMQCIDLDFDKALELFGSAVHDDAELLNEVDKVLFHGLKSIPSTCKNSGCGFVAQIELDGGQALLMPFRERAVDVKSRIHFGTKTPH